MPTWGTEKGVEVSTAFDVESLSSVFRPPIRRKTCSRADRPQLGARATVPQRPRRPQLPRPCRMRLSSSFHLKHPPLPRQLRAIQLWSSSCANGLRSRPYLPPLRLVDKQSKWSKERARAKLSRLYRQQPRGTEMGLPQCCQ